MASSNGGKTKEDKGKGVTIDTSGKLLEADKKKCQKFRTEAAASAAIGAVAGAFTYGIGTLVGTAGAMALEKKAKDCDRKAIQAENGRQLAAEQARIAEEQRLAAEVKKQEEITYNSNALTVGGPRYIGKPLQRSGTISSFVSNNSTIAIIAGSLLLYLLITSLTKKS